MITNINGEKPNSFLKVLLGDCYKPINLEFSYNSNLAFFEKLISITYKEFLNTENTITSPSWFKDISAPIPSYDPFINSLKLSVSDLLK